jgi:cytochrome b
LLVLTKALCFCSSTVSHNLPTLAFLKVLMFTVHIWDLPTRLFHWVLAACVVGLLITGNVGGNAMVWHFRFGYAVLTLLLFRLLWGFVGGHWSRWSQLPLSPNQVWSYIRCQGVPAHHAGHNPLGSWSVLTLLLFLAFQVGTGLVSDDEIANMGPLSSLVSGAVVSWSTTWHKNVGKFILLALIALHLLALVWYRFKKHAALVPAMFHGDKMLSDVVPPSVDDGKSRVLALLCLFSAAGAVAMLVSLGS